MSREKLIAQLREYAEALDRANVHDDIGLSMTHSYAAEVMRSAADNWPESSRLLAQQRATFDSENAAAEARINQPTDPALLPVAEAPPQDDQERAENIACQRENYSFDGYVDLIAAALTDAFQRGAASCAPRTHAEPENTDHVTLNAILDLLAQNRPEGLHWPGVARLIRRVIAPPSPAEKAPTR